jgi:hypothetical protein
MPPDDAAVRGLDRTRRLGQIPGEEVAERSLADKADAGRVLLRVRRDSLFAGDRAHRALRQMTDGEKRAVELALIEPVKKIGLILRSVDRLQQQDAVVGAPQLRVMSCCDALGAERERVIEKGIELDLAVAQNIGVRRSAGSIVVQEIGKHPLAVFAGEVYGLDLDTDHVGDRGGVD